MDRRWIQGGEGEAAVSARLGRTGWSTGWKRPRPRRDETSARLAHAPKPSGGWQTVRGGGSVDHLPLVGVTRRIFLLSLLHRLLRPPLCLFVVGLSRILYGACDPARLCTAIPAILGAPFSVENREIRNSCGITKPHFSSSVLLLFFILLNTQESLSCF